jgi:hypothetical protein
MAVVMMVTVFVGFAPSFWLPFARGAHTSPVITIHALVCSAWLVFFTFQSWLAASGRVARHRDMGLVGVSLATTVPIFGVMAAIDQTRRAALVGDVEAGLRFMAVPIWQVVLVSTLFVAAFATVRRPEWHKRLLLFATAEMAGTAVGRFLLFFVVVRGHLPVPAGMPSPPPPVDAGYPLAFLTDCCFYFVPMLHDWRTEGRVHPAYVVSYAGILGVRLLRPLASVTPAWHSVAAWIYSLVGQ